MRSDSAHVLNAAALQPPSCSTMTKLHLSAKGAKRFPVVATVNGYAWRTSVARMGGEFLLGLSRQVRQAAGVEAGDHVDISLKLDEQPRDLALPDDLAAALASDDEAQAIFEVMAFTHRKEYARWVAEAKRERHSAASRASSAGGDSSREEAHPTPNAGTGTCYSRRETQCACCCKRASKD